MMPYRLLHTKALALCVQNFLYVKSQSGSNVLSKNEETFRTVAFRTGAELLGSGAERLALEGVRSDRSGD